MCIDLKVYPHENLQMIKKMCEVSYFQNEFENLWFDRDYDIFYQIDGHATISELKVPALQITTTASPKDACGDDLKYANCEDFGKIILPKDTSVKNRAIINYLTSLKGWLAVLYWC